MRALVLLLLLPVLFAADLDRDGLDDAEEDRLLERFRPRFFVSPTDCGGLPVVLRPGAADPAVEPSALPAIYGQAFPNGDAMELHYYHIWAVDCGRLAHPWDVEHVSVLVRDGRARFWFAAAHQDTVCDAAHGARASTLHAETRGANVWISHAKHASFLSPSKCSRGCGGDRCDTVTREMPYSPVVNIGEAGRPLNGAEWTASKVWPFAAKMKAEFSAPLIAQIDRKGVPSLDPAKIPVQSVILGGNSAIGGLEKAQSETGDALSISKKKVKGALGRARDWVGKKVK